ncbi:MAG: glutamine phosphoribosylpyrophosphate amidotransferase [Planctomycetota bacterium]|nr:glutamine phosphoribosylpyrophosphate amidotransferase [Planctomycetota bacterium]
MCGIVGYWQKSETTKDGLGKTVMAMLRALACRGPDSAGVALYDAKPANELVLRITVGPNGAADTIRKRATEWGQVNSSSTQSEYMRLSLNFDGDPSDLEAGVESCGDGIEVVSMGRSLEIVKQVGSPENLDKDYGVSEFKGTHGIGHTRMSTESAIDLSHSQPFWAHGSPDLAIVHNGHITNYHKMRRIYEQRGVRFYTENDSEVIGIYLGECLKAGLTLEQSLLKSVDDLDGSFSYLAATPTAMGFARDRFALKPLLFTETEEFVAVATEEIALRTAFDGEFSVGEARAKEVRVWER